MISATTTLDILHTGPLNLDLLETVETAAAVEISTTDPETGQ